jgi:hypothetical protein
MSNRDSKIGGLSKLAKKIHTDKRDWSINPSKRINETDGNQAALALIGAIMAAHGFNGSRKYINGSDMHFAHPFIMGAGATMTGTSAYNSLKKRKWDHAGPYDKKGKK